MCKRITALMLRAVVIPNMMLLVTVGLVDMGIAAVTATAITMVSIVMAMAAVVLDMAAPMAVDTDPRGRSNLCKKSNKK